MKLQSNPPDREQQPHSPRFIYGDMIHLPKTHRRTMRFSLVEWERLAIEFATRVTHQLRDGWDCRKWVSNVAGDTLEARIDGRCYRIFESIIQVKIYYRTRWTNDTRHRTDV
ncbi:MAG: hypothetical protein Ct9H300mP14_13470 [Gammaproteobacteria bacterium]|nr:MAG: hypothetical protein Ct9H300mP14_13470 [Gammaproteobacteria bacterium]